jgi:hypothetical protein
MQAACPLDYQAQQIENKSLAERRAVVAVIAVLPM